jgi:sarcosine oxidase delta subunit
VDEYWYHVAGCECWIRLRRNLSSHDFIDADHAASGVTN